MLNIFPQGLEVGKCEINILCYIYNYLFVYVLNEWAL